MAGTPLSAFSAFSQAAGAYLNEKTKINNELTEADYKSQSYEFNDAFKSMMMDFENRPDYENFQQEYDSFFEQWKNTVNTNAKTGQSAKALSEMVDNTYQQYKFGLAQSVLNSKKNELRLTTESTIQKIVSDTNMTPAEAWKAVSAEYDKLLANNIITPEQHKIQIASTFSAMMSSRAIDSANAVINAGGSLNEALSAMKSYFSDDMEYKVTDAGSEGFGVIAGEDGLNTIIKGQNESDIRDLIDTKALEADATNKIKITWNTEVKARQDANNGRMEELYASIYQGGDANFMANLQKSKDFLRTMNANTLPDGKLKYWTDVLYGMEEAVAKSATTSQGNSTAKVMAMSAILKNNQKLFINQLAGNMGNYENLYAAQEAWLNTSYQDYLAASGLTESEYTKYDMYLEAGEEIRSFLTEAQGAGIIPGNAMDYYKKAESYLVTAVGEITGKNEKEVNKYFEEIGVDPEEEITKVKSIIWDLMMEVDPNDPDSAKTFKEAFNERIGALYVSRITDYDITRRHGESNDTAIARVAYALGLDKSAFTTDDNNVVWGGQKKTYYADGVEQNRNEYKEAFKTEIMKSVGKVMNLSFSEEETLYDKNALPIFRDTETGDQYKITSDDGKTYSIMKKQNGSNSWEEIKTVDSNALDPEKAVGGNALQYQIQAAEAKLQDKEAPVNAQKEDFSERYEANTETSKVLKEIERREIIPHFYEGFWKGSWIGKVDSEEEFEKWWKKAPEQKKQQYLEWLRDNYSGRYNSMVNGLNN